MSKTWATLFLVITALAFPALAEAQTALSSITAATAINNISNGNYYQIWNWDSLTVGPGLYLSSGSTAAVDGQNLLQVVMANANSTSNVHTYAGFFSNAHSGTTSTNYALWANAESGTHNHGVYGSSGTGSPASDIGDSGIWGDGIATSGTTYGVLGTNKSSGGYAGYFDNSGGGYSAAFMGGNVGIGTATPVNLLDIGTGGGIHIASGVPGSTSMALYNNSGTLTWNGSALLTSAATVTSVSGDGVLISNSASAGAVTLTLGSAAAYSVWGNNTSSSATPSYTTSPTLSGEITDIQSIGATSTDGLILTNTTAASSGNQEWSPRVRWTGQGWKTNSTAASQEVDAIVELQPVQGTVHPAFNWVLSGQVNSGGYGPLLTVPSGGNLNLNSGVYEINGTQLAASNLLNGVTGSGNIVLALSPTLTTPNIGAATGTSLAVTGNITTSGGDVGIGTISPSQTLEVNGIGKIDTGLIVPLIYPASDSTAAIQIDKANGSTNIVDIDTTNGRVGIGTAAPGTLLDIGSAGGTLGTMRLEGSTSGYVQVQSAAAAGSWTMTLPAGAGSNGYVLQTDGTGVTSWVAATGGGTITLGTSASATNPQRSSEATTGLYSLNSGEIDAAVNVSGTGTQIMKWTSGGEDVVSGTLTINNNGIVSSPAAATLHLGAADAASPVAQTLGVQNVVAGTSNTAGASFTFDGSQGTGTGAGGSILFKTAPAGSTGTSQNALSTAMTINGAGNVDIGTASPFDKLVVNGAVHATGTAAGTQAAEIFMDYCAACSPSGARFVIQGPNSSTAGQFTFQLNKGDGTYVASPLVITSSANVGINETSPSYTLHVNGSVAGTSAYVNLSDIRFKTHVQPLAYGLNAVMKLLPIGFDWKNQDQDWKKRHQIGLSAQQIEQVVPEVVTTADDAEHTKSIAYGSLVPVLIKAIQEQQEEIVQLKQAVADLKSKP